MPEAEADSLHQLFEVLRDRAVSVTSGFQARLRDGLDDIDEDSKTSVIQILLSSLLQASNVVLGALKTHDDDDG